MDHLLSYCCFSTRLWAKLLVEFKLLWVTPRSSADLFSMEFFMAGNKEDWNLAVLAICWSLWLESSNRIFDDLREIYYLGSSLVVGGFVAS